MKKKLLFMCFLFGIVINGYCASEKSVVKLKVYWQKYLAQHDLIWDKIPEDYYEGAFVGNGLLGTIIFKDDQKANTLCFEIGRTDVYDHRTSLIKSGHAFGRLPIGRLLLTPVGQILKINLRNDIWNAEIRGELLTTAGTISFRCFVPSQEEVIILNMKNTGQEKNASCTFRPEQGNHPRPTVQPNRDKGIVYLPNPAFRVENINGVEVITQPLLAGDDYATAWSDRSKDDGTRNIFITVANRWAKKLVPGTGSAIDAVATIKSLLKKDMKSMEKSHRDWWHHFYPSSFVTIPDAHLESFYWIQLYKLASATRSNRPAVDLMGPWFKPTVWASYWTNLNIQLAYYTLGITNHLDLAEPLFGLLEKHTDQLINNVPVEYRNNCAGLGNPVGYDDLNAPIGLTDKNNNPMHLIALPWLMQMFFIHNQMSINDDRLRNTIYPLMKRTFNVYDRIMHLQADGRYHIPLTYSDEYGTAAETSLNVALAQWGFKTLIECANRLKIEDPLLPRWKELLTKMSDYNIDSTGIMIGEGVPFAKPHRHYSHLFGIFPLYSLNMEDQTEQIPLMKKSIQHFIGFDGDNCMFKFNGASSLWASIGEGDQALKYLNRSLEILPRNVPTIGLNTLYSENGWPTFESPIASSRSELDMLIQSWGGKIRVFPACPSQWRDAGFYHLRTEGAFLVSAQRKEGKTQFISIQSLAGEPCIIKCDFIDNIKLIAPKTVTMHRHDGLIELNLKKGEEAILYTGAKPASFDISPLTMKTTEMNSWGKHSSGKKLIY